MKHGGNLYEMAKRYNLPEEEIIDFSANINPLGIPKTMKRIIKEEVENLGNYPDIHYDDLLEGIGLKYSLLTDDIYVANGGAQVIFDFIRAVAPSQSLVVYPTFIEYERALQSVDSTIKEFYLLEEEAFQLNLNRLIEEIDDSIDMVILCNPNNPTGSFIQKAALVQLLDVCTQKNIFLMVDEAFMDFMDQDYQNSMMPLCRDFPNLLVTRSFTKFYGVPGLRLGFGVCSDEQIRKRLSKITVPWNINYFASGFGKVLQNEMEYELNTYRWLEGEKKRFTSLLKQFTQLNIYEPSVNFVLIRIIKEGLESSLLKAKLMDYNILIRECDTFKGLNNQFIRIAIKDEDSNNRLIEALKETLK